MRGTASSTPKIGLVATFLLVVLAGCQQLLAPAVARRPLPSALPYQGMSPVTFCQLPALRNQLVYVRGTYSGLDEYWSFNSASKHCENSLPVELTLSEQAIAPFQAQFNTVHDKYLNYYLVVDAIGRYEDEQVHGYGHLGHNKAQFVVQQLVQVQVVAVKGPKRRGVK